MLRKLILGLVTVASLSATVLVPSEASARGFGGGHGFSRGGGFGGGHHFAGGGFRGGRHFGHGGFGRGLGVGMLGVGLGLELLNAAVISNSCRTLLTPSGRAVTVC